MLENGNVRLTITFYYQKCSGQKDRMLLYNRSLISVMPTQKTAQVVLYSTDCVSLKLGECSAFLARFHQLPEWILLASPFRVSAERWGAAVLVMDSFLNWSPMHTASRWGTRRLVYLSPRRYVRAGETAATGWGDKTAHFILGKSDPQLHGVWQRRTRLKPNHTAAAAGRESRAAVEV